MSLKATNSPSDVTSKLVVTLFSVFPSAIDTLIDERGTYVCVQSLVSVQIEYYLTLADELRVTGGHGECQLDGN